MKFQTQVWNFNEVSGQSMKFQTKAWSFRPRYAVLYPGMKFFTQVWRFVPRYKHYMLTFYELGTKVSTQVHNLWETDLCFLHSFIRIMYIPS
jgi:hypothetical protein